MQPLIPLAARRRLKASASVLTSCFTQDIPDPSATSCSTDCQLKLFIS